MQLDTEAEDQKWQDRTNAVRRINTKTKDLYAHGTKSYTVTYQAVIPTARIAFIPHEIQTKHQQKHTHSRSDRLAIKIFPCSGGALRSLEGNKITAK